MFGIGSRSAQTFNESVQNSDAGGGGTASAVVLGKIQALIDSNTPCSVHHMWRKTTRDAATHHSQLFVTDTRNGFIVMDFGLWSDANDKVCFEMDQAKNIRHYTQSSTYSPNPVPITANRLLQAFVSTAVKCGPDYKLLHNNCQKYARLFMTELGAKHKRSFFHL